MSPSDLTLRPLAAAEPPRSATGLFLRWDPDLAIFILVDKNQEDPEKRVVELGPMSSTVIRLREIYGLSPKQATEAVGRAAFGFGDEINLGWVVRTASTKQLGTPEQAPQYVEQIPDPFLRSYGKKLLAYFVGGESRPRIPDGVSPQDAAEMSAVLQSFGIRDPGTIDVDAPRILGEAISRLAAVEVPGDLGDIVRVAEQIQQEAQAISGLVRRELPDLGAALRLMEPPTRQSLAQMLTGTHRLMRALSDQIRDGFGQ